MPRRYREPVPEWSPHTTVLGDPAARPSDRIDVIAVPGPMAVEFECAELTAVCPVTEQRDFYDATISLTAERWTIEAKTLKLYLATFVDRCVFAEHLGHEIATHLAAHVEVPVTVSLRQHVRGGISETVTVTVDPPG
jgi:NADPH-dependent 7-cyano-7-deazaguanine reductase QueF